MLAEFRRGGTQTNKESMSNEPGIENGQEEELGSIELCP